MSTATKTQVVQARVEPKLKKEAAATLRKVGLNTSQAFNMFLRQVVIHKGIPFEARVPNAELRASLRTPKSKMHKFKSVKEMRAYLNSQ